MQVSYAHDHVTHAVIGRGETIDFGISNSAEFFNILSSTLYTDQILAVVRESLCNAWDAHIEAGCTDKPVLVTTVDNKLIIRDFGKGIHHDDIGLIYGTYGNSTKKNDGNQTGGFGLGCKSPFAYTDHFEVISGHAGVRTIYTMAKSSAQVGGKPGITTIAQFPSTETGLSVTITLKPEDVKRFNTLVRRIARNGDMNLRLNGEQITGLDFDTSKNNWMITTADLLDSNTRVMVRYGNVVYPVKDSSAIADKYMKVHQHLEALLNRRRVELPNNFGIVFQAPPHSIAVTPSRESLSMQEHTVRTLNKLFDGFISQLNEQLHTENRRVLDAVVDSAISRKDHFALLKSNNGLPFVDTPITPKEFKINTVSEYADRYMNLHYPKELSFRKEDLTKRITKMVTAGLLDQGTAKTFLDEFSTVDYPPTNGDWGRNKPTEWLRRRVIGKLLTKLSNAGLSNSSLWLRNTQDIRALDNNDRMVKAINALPKDLYSCLPYLRPVVILTNSRGNVHERVQCLSTGPFTAKEYLALDGYFIYVFGRKKGDKEKAQKFFASTKMTVIDLSELEVTKKKETVAVVSKPRPKGLPLLKEIQPNGIGYIDTSRIREDAVSRIEKPEFIVKIQRGYDNFLEGFDNNTTKDLVTLFGTRVGVANTITQFDNWTKKFPSYEDYLVPKVLAYVKNSPNILSFFSKNGTRAADFVDAHPDITVGYSVIRSIYKSPEICKKYGIEDARTNEEIIYTTLFQYICNRWNMPQPIRDEYRAILNCPIDKKLADLIKQMAKSTLLSSLNMLELDNQLRKQETKKKALQLFFYALNN